jgi:hypothetical protein
VAARGPPARLAYDCDARPRYSRLAVAGRRFAQWESRDLSPIGEISIADRTSRADEMECIESVTALELE